MLTLKELLLSAVIAVAIWPFFVIAIVAAVELIDGP